MKFKYVHSWIRIVVFIQICYSAPTHGQTITNKARPFYGYYYDFKLANPAFAAFEDQLRVTQMYSGTPFNETREMQKSYFSYEGKLEQTNSGIGALFINEHLGPRSETGAALFYRYKFNISQKSDLRLGLQVSRTTQVIDHSKFYQPIDPDDPLLIDAYEKRRFINMDIGLVYHSPWVTLGGSVKKILKQDISGPLDSGKVDYSSINFIITKTFKVSQVLTATPSVFYLSEPSRDQLDFNCSFEIIKWIIIGGGYQLSMDDESSDGYITLNAGLNIRDHIQFVTHIYAGDNQKNSDYYSGMKTFVEVMLRFRVLDKTSDE